MKYGGANGCQTDYDTGLVLMGHRYYDTRIGRFIGQDPIGDGDNWYAYADNSPTNAVDPGGLVPWYTGQPDTAGEIPGFTGTPTGYLPSGDPHFVPNGGPESNVNPDDPSSWAYDLDGYGYTGPNGPDTRGGGDDSGPGQFDGVGGAALVGLSAVGSAASMGLWDGGAARNDPSFGVSKGLANIGIAAGTGAVGGAIGAVGGAIGAVGETAGEGETLVTHWNTAARLANVAKNGLEEGDWVMKGKPNWIKWILTGRFLNYSYKNSITLSLPDYTITQQQVDIVQKTLGHFRYWPGVF